MDSFSFVIDFTLSNEKMDEIYHKKRRNSGKIARVLYIIHEKSSKLLRAFSLLAFFSLLGLMDLDKHCIHPPLL